MRKLFFSLLKASSSIIDVPLYTNSRNWWTRPIFMNSWKVALVLELKNLSDKMEIKKSSVQTL
jgi:hypothetical protein